MPAMTSRLQLPGGGEDEDLMRMMRNDQELDNFAKLLSLQS